MAKSKKSDSKKASKDKAPKALKPEKSVEDKQGKKKDKAPKEIAVAKPVKAVEAPKPVKKATKPAKAVAPGPAPSSDDISLRAYFIAERRQAMGWPGDSSSDWVEAERQLKAEAARKTKL